MSMAAMARKTTRLVHAPSAFGGGRRLWHAPLPSRSRFAVRGADSVGPASVNAAGGGMWTASAWSRFCSQQPGAAGSTNPQGWNGGPSGQQAIWRALVDIRALAERMDDRSAKLLHASISQAANLQRILRLVKRRSIGHAFWNGFSTLIFAGLFSVAYLLYYIGVDTSIAFLDEFLKTRVNKAVTDPETQRNLMNAFVMFSDTIYKRFNPWYKIRSLVTGIEEDVPEMTNSEMVSKDTFFALSILLLLQVDYDFGVTFDKLQEGLNTVGIKGDTALFEMLEFLKQIGYVETMETGNVREKGVFRTSYWPSRKAMHDGTSGLLEKKVRKALQLRLKEIAKGKEAAEAK